MTTAAAPTRPLHRHIPGEPELWIFVFGDLIVFGLFFGVLGWQHVADPAAYRTGQQDLHRSFGMLNTLLLLTSSAAVASGLATARRARYATARRWYQAAIALGVGFVVVKAIEYTSLAHTAAAASDFGTNYFVFTGIHLMHLIAGLTCLSVAATQCRRAASGLAAAPSERLLEGLGVYWHLVDVLWIALFALLYLI